MKFFYGSCLVFLLICNANAIISGPFLMWGYEKVKDIQLPALETVEEKVLTSIFTDAKSIVIFISNDTIRLNKLNYPNLQNLVEKSNNWAYLPQYTLPAEPIDYNSNVEIFSLVGPSSQQDIEITALYHDAITIYGEDGVLGILANQADYPHTIYKRETNQEDFPSSTAGPNSPTDEPPKSFDDQTYIAEGKAILYTISPPELTINNVSKILKEHQLATFDDRLNTKGHYVLSIKFKTENTKTLTTVRFKFPVSGGYWSLKSVEIDEDQTNLTVVGEPPSAPIGFSYKCSRPLLFTNGTTNSLKLDSIQVQILLKESNRFSEAYDCIGFTSVPIWSGVFVSFIIVTVTFIGILAILEIKAPNRFESSRSKQLTINVQE